MFGISMNLDELVSFVPETDLRENLSHWVGEWNHDDKGIDELVYTRVQAHLIPLLSILKNQSSMSIYYMVSAYCTNHLLITP